jgi:prepilin-type N-terminal cleavage/methylation domain-containing protein
MEDCMKKAFTLAEVLITLGIIGIVAAITMPNLIAQYEKKATVEKLKTAYSILAQAVQRSEMDNGSMGEWDFDLDRLTFFDTYIAPYLKGVKKIPFRADFWKGLNGLAADYVLQPQYSLPNGMTMGILTMTGRYRYATFAVDLNGDKKPNKFGRDVFAFSILAVVPYEEANIKMKFQPGSIEQCGSGAAHYRLTREQLLILGCATCRNDGGTSRGYGCSALIIMQDGWEIKNDYPW